MTWRGYFAVENLNLTSQQESDLWVEIKMLGPGQAEVRPNYKNHWRFNLAGTAGIYEGLFQDDELSISNFRQIMGRVLGVVPGDIGVNTKFQTYDTYATRIVTYSLLAVNVVRFAAFGDIFSPWERSHQEALAYLAANRAEWESSEAALLVQAEAIPSVEDTGLVETAKGWARSALSKLRKAISK